MFKKNLYLTVCMFAFIASAIAMNDFDTFVRDHCGSACLGEKDDCQQCYNEAIDMSDSENPVSPEIPLDLRYDRGKLQWVF